jgi:hypothetical protein
MNYDNTNYEIYFIYGWQVPRTERYISYREEVGYVTQPTGVIGDDGEGGVVYVGVLLDQSSFVSELDAQRMLEDSNLLAGIDEYFPNFRVMSGPPKFATVMIIS